MLNSIFFVIIYIGDIMIKSDSRKITQGDTFIALKGPDTDGHDYIEKAIENGASKIVAEHGEYNIETLIVDDTRKYFADYLKEEYKGIMDELTLVGITGTNGKTTTAFLAHIALNMLGIKAAYIGTIGFYINEKIESLNNTTPDLDILYKFYEESYNNGCKVVVQEVSSQGLAYRRLEGITFDYSIFTNLTQDHLDYHGTMENYVLAKKELFLNTRKLGIVNYDDEYKDYFMINDLRTVYYGINGGEYKITKYNMNHLETDFTLSYNNDTYEIKTKLIGEYNLYNLLAVIALLHEMGIEINKIVDLIPTLPTPLGRMETIKYKDNSIIIDYAHTPDAIEKIINTVKNVSKGKIYVVFGSTGDRDKTKRPIMTKFITDNTDKLIITSDDLHNEDFNNIVSDMINGLDNTNYEIEKNRGLAIKKGIELLDKNDTLLILGKGHEEYIIVGDEKIPFNDKEEILKYIN